MSTATPIPPWPTTVPTAAEMLSHILAQGLAASARSLPLMQAWRAAEAIEDPVEQVAAVAEAARRWQLNCAWMQYSHDVAFLLQHIAEGSVTDANRCAARIWAADDAGDGYGQWLWEWADHVGLDADGICDWARTHVPSATGTADRERNA